MNDLKHLMEQGNECIRQKKYQQALLYFNSAALLSPEHTEALIHCAEVLLHLNRPAEATVYSQRALQLHCIPQTLTLHAKALYKMGEYSKALEYFERVIVEEPNNYVALNQRALCLTQVNRYDEASAAYQQALAYSNYQDPWVYYNYSLCLLAMGNLLLGFTAFESRWQSLLSIKRCNWILPESASIEMLQGKSILIHSEQGLGDSIQFFRYVPLLVQLGARVFFEIQPALIPLFYPSRNTISFIAIGSPLPACDYHCPLMSLARLFKTEIDTIPRSIPYVFPDINILEACQKKLGHSSNRRIGIAWKGSSLNIENQKRSITLTALLTLHQSDLDFICLQKDVYLEEKKELEQYQIAYHSLELSTLVGTAALISCLDLVITIDTSIAHLAAAMGKEVWILLPFSADWRWFLQRSDSPWYPNVKLFRQETLGDWSVPLAMIKNTLMVLPPILSQNSIEDLLCEAHLQFQNGLFLKAEQLYRNILIKNPGCHDAAQGIALTALQQNNMADAIQFMQQAIEIAPANVLYRRNLGELLRRVGQLEAAIVAHNTAVSLEPDSSENHFHLALAYNDKHQFKLAIQHYRIAISMDQNYDLAWNNLGTSLESIGDIPQAKNAYTMAIRLNPNHAEAQNNLGAIYSEEGQIDAARTHFEAAIAANPDFIEAHYNLSLIKTYTAEDPHLVLLETYGQKINHCSVKARIHYYFALGKALDDTQHFTRAFQAYAEGNRLYSLQKPWNKTNLQNIVEYLPKVFTQSFLQQPKSSKETRCPIFIVGMPRAGTTLIEQILSSHKNIYGAGELDILDGVLQEACLASELPFHIWVSQLTDSDFAVLGEKYLDRTWQLAPDKQFIIDKMPSNCFYIGMIYRMLPTAKIIHAMRDPMDACFSCYTRLFKDSMFFAYNLHDLGHYYSLYAQTMQHWHAVLPATVIFDLPYEHMVVDHETLSKQIVEYIGLAWDPNCLNFYKNDRVVKTASLNQVRKPIYKSSIQRWRHFAENLKPLLEIVTPYRNKYAYDLHLRGITAYQANKIDVAVQLIETAIHCSPNIALFHSNLGEMHRQLKASALSIQYGENAIALAPNSATAFSNLGISYYDAQQYEQAEKCHQQALALNPRLSCSLNNLGSIYSAYEKINEAIEFYQAAIAASPHFIEPLNNLGALFVQQQEFTQALPYLQQALLLAPNFTDAHCNLGLAFLGLEHYDPALLHFEKALQLNPDYAEAYYGCAKLYLHQHHFTKAETYIRKALLINPKQIEFYKILAEIYHEQGQHTQALRYLNQALEIDPTHSGLHLSKGNILMEMGEIAKAAEQFSEVTNHPTADKRILAHYCLVQLRKVKSNDESLEDLLSISHNIERVSSNKLEYLYFALGKCYDDIGEYANAFENFTKGCRLKRQRIIYNIADQIQFTQRLIDCFTQQTIEYLQAFANSSPLPIFIVGMPRSGSTLVEQVLSSHAQIYGAGELKYLTNLIQRPIKNQHTTLYYPENIKQLSPEILRDIPNKYISYLQQFSSSATRITDKMPNNFIAIGLIHALLPNAKIIHVKRNPMDTCLSCYTQLFTEGQSYSYDLTELGQYYQCYENIMNHWRQILPANTWLDIEYEAMVGNMETDAQRLIEFCDLPWDPACLAFHQSKRQVRTASFLQVRQPVYTSSIERWRRYEQELAPLIKALNLNIAVLPSNNYDQNLVSQ